jgi:hypothetical protein
VKPIVRLMPLVLAAGLLAGCGVQSAAPTEQGRLTVQIHLNKVRLPAGMPLNGYAVLTNNTHKPLPLDGCPSDWLTVGLANASTSFNPAFADDCFGTNELMPGPHRVPISGYTTYSGCGGGDAGPPCPSFGAPLLPLGQYHVKVITMGLPKGTVVSATPLVILVNAQTGAGSGAEGSAILVEATGCAWTGTRASESVPVSVTVLLNHLVVARFWARGQAQFILPAAPNARYVIRTSAHRGGSVQTSSGVQSYINLFSHYRAGDRWLWSCKNG